MNIKIFKLIIAITLSELAGVLGVLFTAPAVSTWYATLPKPPLTPPSWVFGPVWTSLYFLIGIALFLVWKNQWRIVNPVLQGERKPWNKWSERLWTGDWKTVNIIGIFFLQYALNILWSYVFFGLRAPGAAFFVLVALWFAIVHLIANFYRVSKSAAWLLVPYIVWVTFAGYLNFGIWQLSGMVDAYCSPTVLTACVGGSDVASTITTQGDMVKAFKNGTYAIDSAPVTLLGGISVVLAAPDSVAEVTTRYLGNEAFGDLNGDGRDDGIFILAQENGGSGTFFYAAAALSSDQGYMGTNAVLLGDRIAPQTTEFKNGLIIVNYAERSPGEPMTAQPSVGVSKYFSVGLGALIEWKTTPSMGGLHFRYPEQLPAAYISAVDWPPQMKLLDQSFSCAIGGSESADLGKTEERTVNGQTYCVTEESEGAAGSIYTTSTYVFFQGDKIFKLTFVLRAVQCANYNDPQQIVCNRERAAFNLDTIADGIAQSVFFAGQ